VIHFHAVVEILVRSLVAISAVSGFLFVLIYQLRWKWWRSSMGRHMMAFMGGLELLLLLAFISQFWPHLPLREYLRIVSWGIVAFLFTWRLVILITVKKEERPSLSEIDREISELQKMKNEIIKESGNESATVDNS
jgi:hypothetical protein